MPIKHASIKDLRKSKRAYLRNQKVRDSLAGLKKKLKKAWTAKDAVALKKLLPLWQKACDKAKKVGVIKKNAANRYKSNWMKRSK